MVKTVSKNIVAEYLPFLEYIPQSLIIKDGAPYFIEFEYPTDEEIILDGENIKDVFKERIDPYGDHSTLISQRRSLRPQPDLADDTYKISDSCLFDDKSRIASPQEEYKDLGVFSAPNPFAFNPGFHDLIITEDHVETIDQIKESHIYGIISALKIRAQKMKTDHDIDQLDMGINFGTDKLKYPSGASQPHLHAQIGAVFKNGFMPIQDKVQYINDQFKGLSIDYEELYIQALKSSALIASENNSFYAITPFAPRFKDEINIISKNKNIPNIISTTEKDIKDLSEIIYKSIKALENLSVPDKDGREVNVGIKSFNIDFLGLRFERIEGRMIIYILPRQTEIAYSELLGRFVIDRSPEETARYIKYE